MSSPLTGPFPLQVSFIIIISVFLVFLFLFLKFESEKICISDMIVFHCWEGIKSEIYDMVQSCW